MSPWAARIKTLLDAGAANGLSEPGLARACGAKQPSVWQWFNDTEKKQATKMISGDNLVAAAAYLGTTAEWIMTGRTSMAPSQSARLDRQKLIAAIKIAMRSEGGVTAENIADAYELLIERAAAPEPSGTPRPNPKGPSGNGAVRGRDSGAVEDPGRTIGARKKAKA